MDSLLPEADCLLVVPPLCSLAWPPVGVPLLQAVAEEAGLRVAVFYANLAYAARVGAATYQLLDGAPRSLLIGERLFATPAFGTPRLGGDDLVAHLQAPAPPPRSDGRAPDDRIGTAVQMWRAAGARLGPADLHHLAGEAEALVEEVGAAIAGRRYPVVGATTAYDQSAAALAILAAVRRHHPAVVTLLGGPNCQGEMAAGLASLADGVDYVVRGEGERVFVELLLALRRGRPPPRGVIQGAPVADLDDLPLPRFEAWFEQRAALLPDLPPSTAWVSYESSRGCWWGRCTFCGLNGEQAGLRVRSARRVLADLGSLGERHPGAWIGMADNVMPRTFHRSVIPHLGRLGVRLFYEQRPDLTLEQVRGLRTAGVLAIQPGIEALSTPLLELMRKGTTASANLSVLRYAASVGVAVRWSLLWGLPDDQVEHYRATAALVPLITHLHPPNAVSPLSLDRFSPYVQRPDDWGITDLQPLASYRAVFPASAERVATHFTGRYPSGSVACPEVVSELEGAVAAWKELWIADRRPSLLLSEVGPGRYSLVDTRPIAEAPHYLLDRDQALAVLVGGAPAELPAADWALRGRFAVLMDERCVPLATARPELIQALERTGRDDQPGALGQ